MIDLKYIKARIGDSVERFPELWRNLQVYRFRKNPFLRRIITPGHDIVIEGYPRSANSFAVRAFLFDNGWQSVKIATHSHCAAQIVLAIKWNIPTLVLIRSPEKAVVSLLALGIQQKFFQADKMTRKEKLRWTKYYTSEYSRFYKTIQPYGDKYVLAEFKEATENFGQVIRRFNEKFYTHWSEFDSTEKSVKKIFETSRLHLAPNSKREELKREFVELFFSEDNSLQRQEAENIYQAMIMQNKNHKDCLLSSY